MATGYEEPSLVEVCGTTAEVNSAPNVDQGSGMEAVAVTADSGACNAVGPLHVGAHCPIKPAEASKVVNHYSAANSSVISNHGQRVIERRSEDGADG